VRAALSVALYDDDYGADDLVDVDRMERYSLSPTAWSDKA